MTSSQLTATWTGEEVEVQFSGIPEKVDYGVPRSPVWWEVEDITVEEVRILGVPVPFKSLPDDLQKNIMDLSHDLEWDM